MNRILHIVRTARASAACLAVIAATFVAACGSDTSAPTSGALGSERLPAGIEAVAGGIVPANKVIGTEGSGGQGQSDVALVRFKVVDQSGTPLPGVKVDFSTQSTKPVTLLNNAAISDSGGIATAVLRSGPLPAQVRVIAEVILQTGSGVAAISEPITVSTPTPSQFALLLSPAQFYLEALDVDASNRITLVMTDAFGTPASGATVRIDANIGAFDGGSSGSCVVQQGECTVNWHTPTARTPDGLTTLVASSQAGGSLVSASLTFYASGSSATVLAVNLDPFSGMVMSRLTSGGAITMDFAGSCAARTFDIEVVDRNGNPMPEGTSITAANLTNVTASVSPSRVGYTGMRLGLTERGTIHAVTVTPSGCVATGTNTRGASMDLRVKSPKGTETLTHVNLGSFPTT